MKDKIERWLKIEKIKFCLFFVLLIALLMILLSQAFTDMNQDQENYISITNDALDERMSSLYNELNSLPSGAGNDVLFLSNLVNVNDFIFNSSDELKIREEINELKQDFSEFLDQNIAYKRLTIIKLDDSSEINAERQLDGKIIIDSVLEQSLVSQEFLDKVVNLEKDKVYISDLQKDIISSDSNNLVLYYATPIFNGQEKPGGILILTVDPSYFLDDVRNFSRPGEQVFLVSSSGSYLANYDINKEYINSGDKFNFKKDFSEAADEILSLSNRRIVKTKDYVFAFRYIQPSLSKFDMYKSGTDTSQSRFYWVLVSVSDRQNVDTILSVIKKQRLLFILITIIIALFIGLIVISMHWGLVNKIKSPGA